MATPVYKRVLVKISGEALKNGCEGDILDFDFMDKVVSSVGKCPCYTRQWRFIGRGSIADAGHSDS